MVPENCLRKLTKKKQALMTHEIQLSPLTRLFQVQIYRTCRLIQTAFLWGIRVTIYGCGFFYTWFPIGPRQTRTDCIRGRSSLKRALGLWLHSFLRGWTLPWNSCSHFFPLRYRLEENDTSSILHLEQQTWYPGRKHRFDGYHCPPESYSWRYRRSFLFFLSSIGFINQSPQKIVHNVVVVNSRGWFAFCRRTEVKSVNHGDFTRQGCLSSSLLGIDDSSVYSL